MFIRIAVNNLYVLLIYVSAGLLVVYLTGSKLATSAPWSVFALHMLQIAMGLTVNIRQVGLLPCLALVLPHAWLEISGLSMGCSAGTRFCRGQHPVALCVLAAVLIIIGAFVETYITPFPLDQWLE